MSHSSTPSFLKSHIVLLSIYSLFPIGLDFLFIPFSLHFFLSWTSSLSISNSVISASTLSNHVLLGLSTGHLSSTLNSIHFFTQASSRFLITCPYHLSLPSLMTVVIGSTPTSHLNYSFVLLSFTTAPLVNPFYIYCALNRVYRHFIPTDTGPLSRVYNHLPTTTTNHHFRLIYA